MMASQTIQEKIVDLQGYIDSEQIPQNSRPKIQRVPHYLGNRKKFEEHYTPKLVSIGPIHHDNPNLKLGEKYKLMGAAKYIENTKQNPEELHKKIADNINELKGRFSDDVLTSTRESLKGYHSLEEKLSWMLFVDGCFLLSILEKSMFCGLGLNIKVDQLFLVMMDVLLLENQLPYEVLRLLWKDNNESELIKSMRSFPNHLRIIPDVSIPLPETPTHLLDLQRKIILTTSNSKTNLKTDSGMVTYRNIQDLKAVGITLKSSATRRPADIDFSDGWFAAKLTLPMITVDDGSAPTFLNLVAYEMCPDFDNDYGICSFVVFMDSLIDHPEDVKELRSKGILHNCLGSDEEVANLFNMISTDLVPNADTYSEVRAKIHDHYRNRCNTWIAQGFHTYFSSPWAIIAFIAAVIALVLTFIQTWFTVNPPSK